MSYVALYRKYRSRNFDEIVGQEHVTNTLKNQICNDKIAHAYLLCGIRGVGKTSIARILAKAVNCENPKAGNPCLECEMCRDIDDSSNLNVIEIDAASNTGVDNIKEIRDDAAYMPSKGKYKVYIIDEVHMLSNNAFNALLKILEEPPKHIIFIFATTESQKIPATILSRCQRFDLKRISRDLMVERINEYLANEGLKVEDKAVKYIVSLSEGSMRDALSVLEQVISIKRGEEVTLEDILNTLGNVDYTTFHKLTKSISDKDVTTAIETVNRIYEDGKEIRNFVVQYITYLRNLLLIINSSNAADIIDMSKENVDEIKALSKELSSNEIIKIIETMSKTEADMRYSNMPKLSLEITLIRLCEANKQVDVVVKESSNSTTTSTKAKADNSNDISSETDKGSNKEDNKEKEVVSETVKETKVNEPVEALTNSADQLTAWRSVKASASALTKAYLDKTVATKVTDSEYYVLCDNDALKGILDGKIKELTAALENAGVKGRRLVLYVEENLKKNENMNNSSKKDDTNIDEIADNFANLGIEVKLN